MRPFIPPYIPPSRQRDYAALTHKQQREYYRWTKCIRKPRFESAAEAWAYHREQNMTGICNVYQCGFCSGFHIGRVTKEVRTWNEAG